MGEYRLDLLPLVGLDGVPDQTVREEAPALQTL
jgi:hypothetical protein